jgi:hypothetical protein
MTHNVEVENQRTLMKNVLSLSVSESVRKGDRPGKLSIYKRVYFK